MRASRTALRSAGSIGTPSAHKNDREKFEIVCLQFEKSSMGLTARSRCHPNVPCYAWRKGDGSNRDANRGLPSDIRGQLLALEAVTNMGKSF